jgi:hypothetical protein
MAKKYLGYSADDKKSPYIKFLKDDIENLVQEKSQCLITQYQLSDFLKLEALHLLENDGYHTIENGFYEDIDDSVIVAVKTDMPGVSPIMWHWWFGWHGCEDARYKLWHPKSHLSAIWEDGRDDVCYIGRNSIISEYIGKNKLDASIQFKSPVEFGFSLDSINDYDKQVFICAKLGHPTLPIDYGYLVHQVRATSHGSEMRSRFFVGGRYVENRVGSNIPSVVLNIIKKVKKLPTHFGRDLFIHCCEEMHHLAKVLPSLYSEFFNSSKLAISGSISTREDKAFDAKVMATLFNKVNPGLRPLKIVEPKTVEDIIASVKYAKANGLKVTVSSGGHSFSANFIREGAVLILMKNFNKYTVNVEAMTAEAGPGVGGSVLMHALYDKNLFFPAGHCKGVCIGGYLLQGGYGWNGRKLGIACQHILAMDIVTADGVFIHANANQNADIFWAAKGSGPGFFGIVTKFYLNVFPLPKYRAVMAHYFSIKHLEDVYRWAHEVGPSIPKAVEFQMLMNSNMMNIMGPGIEAFAPIFADTEDEFEEAKSFMINSPIKSKAYVKTPAFNPGIEMLYKAAMSHYPSDHHWSVDNMWTHAPIDDLLPHIKEIAQSLPPAPSHFLWLNWHPGALKNDMAYSKEDQIYLALYSCWKNKADTDKYQPWAYDIMHKMSYLSTGIQLADESLHKRKSSFMSEAHLQKVQDIRHKWDGDSLFYEWWSW